MHIIVYFTQKWMKKGKKAPVIQQHRANKSLMPQLNNDRKITETMLKETKKMFL